MTIFEKIINREAPASILFEDDLCIVIKSIEPKAKYHFLVIPKKVIPSLAEVKKEDESLLGHLLYVCAKLAEEYNFAETGYRTIINCNADAGQTVYHLHIHLIGGEKLPFAG